MQAAVRRVLVIFPFEERIYQQAGVDVRFVGHPLIDVAVARESRSSFLAAQGLKAEAPTVALLPGSRRNEVAHTFPSLSRQSRSYARECQAYSFWLPGRPASRNTTGLPWRARAPSWYGIAPTT